MTCGDGSMTGRYTFSVNTTKKPTPGRGEEAEAAARKGERFECVVVRGHWVVRVLRWDLPERRMWCRYADQGFSLRPWDGIQFTKDVDRCEAKQSLDAEIGAVLC